MAMTSWRGREHRIRTTHGESASAIHVMMGTLDYEEVRETYTTNDHLALADGHLKNREHGTVIRGHGLRDYLRVERVRL